MSTSKKDPILEKTLLKLTVGEIMNRKVHTLGPEATVEEIIDLILRQRANGILIVDGHRKVLGIITRRDIADILQGEVFQNIPASAVMIKPVITVSPEEEVEIARNMMLRNQIAQLPVVNNTGRLLGILTSDNLRDKYYMQLEEIGRNLWIAMDTVRVAIYVVNAKGIVVYWNSSVEELYGVKAEKIVGRPMVEYFPNALLQRVIETGEGFDLIEHQPREGTHVIISATPIKREGRLIGAVSTERDVTELMNLTKEVQKFRHQVSYLEEEIKKIRNDRFPLENFIAKSPNMIAILDLVKRVANTEAAVLIRGESGTGKELIAHALHLESARREQPFIVIDCSAIPETLLESELFGYEAGAFTGANQAGKLGKFELAEGGTILLDEIGDMPVEMQAKMLRVLQNKMFYRVGGVKPIKVNVRVVAATNRNLESMIKQGTFREDLYYRLDVVSIRLPPLRERKEDIQLLIDKFMKEFSGKYKKLILRIQPEVISTLLDYDWPGNVRELKNVIERLVVLTEDNIIKATYLPEHLRQQALTGNKQREAVTVNQLIPLSEIVQEAEKQVIALALNQAKQNRSHAAKLLDIPRSTLYYKLDELEIIKK
jgi:PAS domain S-box-containing protein